MAKKKQEKLFKAVCVRRCFKFNTLWKPGDVYEGVDDPGKHFSTEEDYEPDVPPRVPGDDPRSNDELRKALKAHPFNFTAPKSWNRKQIWAKLRDLEHAASKMAEEDDGPKMNITASARKTAAKKKAE